MNRRHGQHQSPLYPECSENTRNRCSPFQRGDLVFYPRDTLSVEKRFYAMHVDFSGPTDGGVALCNLFWNARVKWRWLYSPQRKVPTWPQVSRLPPVRLRMWKRFRSSCVRSCVAVSTDCRFFKARRFARPSLRRSPSLLKGNGAERRLHNCRWQQA